NLNGAAARVADASDPAHNSALAGLTTLAADLQLINGATAALAGTLAVSGTLGIDAHFNTFGSALSIGGGLINTGTVTVGLTNSAGGSTLAIGGALDNAGSLFVLADSTAAQTTVTAATLNNTGTLDLEGDRGGAKAVLDITAGAAPAVLASTVMLFG